MVGRLRRWARKLGWVRGVVVLIATGLLLPLMTVIAVDLYRKATAEPASTDVRIFAPLKRNLTITDRLGGICKPSYIAMVARGVMQCWESSNVYYDPCYLTRDQDSLPASEREFVCINAPWSDEAVAFSLWSVAPLGSLAREPVPLEQATPWALELSNEERCVRRTARNEYVLLNLPVTYYCSRTGAPIVDSRHSAGVSNVVLGDLSRSEPLWTAQYLALGSNEIVEVGVIRAWL